MVQAGQLLGSGALVLTSARAFGMAARLWRGRQTVLDDPGVIGHEEVCHDFRNKKLAGRFRAQLTVGDSRAVFPVFYGTLPTPPQVPLGNPPRRGIQFEIDMAKSKDQIFEVACPDCGAMLRIDAKTGALVSHTSAPRKRMFEDLETAAKAMRDQDERKESIFRQSVEAEKNKEDLFEKKFAEALRKAKDAPEGKPLREFDLD